MKEPHHGVMAVTGYGDTLEVFKDAEPVPTAWPSEVRFRPCRSHRRAMTSATSSRRIAPRCRCMSTWWPWTRPTTPGRARSSPACSPLSDSKPTRISCGSSPTVSSTSSSTPDAANSSPRTQSRSRCWQLPTSWAFRGRTTRSSVDALANPHLMGNIEGEAAAINPSGVPRREVQRLHRRAPGRAARRCAERTRLGDLSGRLAARGHPRSYAPRPSCSVQGRRPRPSCSAPRCGSCATVRISQHTLRDDPSLVPVFIEETLRHGESGQDRVPVGGAVDHALRGSIFRRAPRS